MSDRKNEWFVKTVPHSNPDSAACGVKMFRIEDYCGVICEISPRSHFPVHVKASHAHLIAAAPALLEACEEAMFLAAHGIGALGHDKANNDRNIEAIKRIHEKLRAAIAAAKGETV